MDFLVAICVGVGLSAACGLRVFLPMLLLSAAAKLGWVSLAHGFDWVAGWPALVAFGVASVLEVGAGHIPWIDHAVDVLAAPCAIAVGTLAMATQLDSAQPLIGWAGTLAAGGAVGGTIAGGVKLVGATTRVASTASTAGLANPILASVETIGATLLSMLAILVPVAAGVLILAIVAAAVVVVRRRRARRHAVVQQIASCPATLPLTRRTARAPEVTEAAA